MTRDPETDRVTGATGLLNVWLLKHDGIKEKGRKSVDAISMELESGFLDQGVKEEVPEEECADILANLKVGTLFSLFFRPVFFRGVI